MQPTPGRKILRQTTPKRHPSQHQTKHWVVVNHLYQQDSQTWVNIYNPYHNTYEDYPFDFIHTSWDFEVMIINPEDLQ